jgi:hypothetical protein
MSEKISVGDIVKVTGRVSANGLTGKVTSIQVTQYQGVCGTKAPAEYADVTLGGFGQKILTKHLKKIN